MGMKSERRNEEELERRRDTLEAIRECAVFAVNHGQCVYQTVEEAQEEDENDTSPDIDEVAEALSEESSDEELAVKREQELAEITKKCDDGIKALSNTSIDSTGVALQGCFMEDKKAAEAERKSIEWQRQFREDVADGKEPVIQMGQVISRKSALDDKALPIVGLMFHESYKKATVIDFSCIHNVEILDTFLMGPRKAYGASKMASLLLNKNGTKCIRMTVLDKDELKHKIDCTQAEFIALCLYVYLEMQGKTNSKSYGRMRDNITAWTYNSRLQIIFEGVYPDAERLLMFNSASLYASRLSGEPV